MYEVYKNVFSALDLNFSDKFRLSLVEKSKETNLKVLIKWIDPQNSSLRYLVTDSLKSASYGQIPSGFLYYFFKSLHEDQLMQADFKKAEDIDQIMKSVSNIFNAFECESVKKVKVLSDLFQIWGEYSKAHWFNVSLIKEVLSKYCQKFHTDQVYLLENFVFWYMLVYNWIKTSPAEFSEVPLPLLFFEFTKKNRLFSLRATNQRLAYIPEFLRIRMLSVFPSLLSASLPHHFDRIK